MTTSPKIDHEKAIGIIDDVLARVSADRNSHAIMQQCMNAWRELVTASAALSERIVQWEKTNEEAQAEIERLRRQVESFKIALESPESADVRKPTNGAAEEEKDAQSQSAGQQ